jgi:hypothetical protein
VARFLADAAARRDAWRHELGFLPDELVVLFVSEPFDDEDRLADGRPRVGYDQASTLTALLRAADQVAAVAGRRVSVIARPHPREDPRALAGVAAAWVSDHVRVQVSGEGDARRWIVAADAVAGMTSVVLIEAALGGRPALSVQIGLRESGRPDPNLANALGLTRPVLDPAALVDALGEAAAGRGARPDAGRLHQIAGPGCAARVADVVVARGGLVQT